MSKHEWKKLTKNEWKKWVGVVGRMLLAYALIFAQGAWAVQNQGTKDKSSPSQKTAAQQKASATAPTKTPAEAEESESAVTRERPDDAAHQGIKVHGHWTIDVRNPDGSLATHREFENSLVAGQGDVLLAQVLGRKHTVGSWQIILDGSPEPCQLSQPGTAIASSCFIKEPNWTQNNGDFSTLTVMLAAPSLVLSGNATATYSGNITDVTSILNVCDPSDAPTPDLGTGPKPITLAQCFSERTANVTHASASPSNTSFSSPVPVSAGQTIQVTVNISFS